MQIPLRSWRDWITPARQRLLSKRLLRALSLALMLCTGWTPLQHSSRSRSRSRAASWVAWTASQLLQRSSPPSWQTRSVLHLRDLATQVPSVQPLSPCILDVPPPPGLCKAALQPGCSHLQSVLHH